MQMSDENFLTNPKILQTPKIAIVEKFADSFKKLKSLTIILSPSLFQLSNEQTHKTHTNSRLILASELTVIAGFHNDNNNNNGTSQTERNVVSIIPHNKFSKESFDSDIAVLKVRVEI
jgi:hypothetical protein